MASADKELEQQLEDAGNKLLNPPSSVDELLPLLDQVESYLVKVEQSPTKSMQSALVPSQTALITDQLFRHSDVDVKVAVASCISEITRITAPEAPYDDDQMKDVFQLIVSSFEDLDDKSSRSYVKRTSILETVAKVRSCVVMLDLDLDALILDMFQKFLKSVRDHHPENVISSMETIMQLVLEESEDCPPKLFLPLLASVKKGNEEVLPVARKLVESVLAKCTTQVKQGLSAAVKALQTSLDDYSDVVVSICQDVRLDDSEPADNNKVEGSKSDGALVDEAAEANKDLTAGVGSSEVPTSAGKSSKSVVSNGVAKTRVAESLAESDSLKAPEEDKATEDTKSENVEVNVSVTEKVAKKESRPEQSNRKRARKANSSAKLIGRSEGKHTADDKEVEKLPEGKSHGIDAPNSPHADQSVSGDAAGASESKLKNDMQPLSPKAVDGESLAASPSASESPVDETLAKKVARLKKKEGSVKELVQSTDDVQKRASEGTSDSEVKTTKRSGRKAPSGTSNNDKSVKRTETSKKESGGSELDAKLLKQSSKADEGSKTAEGSSLKQSEDKNRRMRGKAVSGKNVAKTLPKDDDNENISSLKSAIKQGKEEHPIEETPKTSSKRKRDVGKSAEKEVASDAKGYGDEIVGSRVQVYWPQDRKFYMGTVQSYDATKKKHVVVYDDGDEEILNMKRQKFKFINSESGASDSEDEGEAAKPSSPDASSEIPVKKKAKTEQSAKKEKMDASPKRGGGASSKSKSVAAGGKPGRKLKEVDETDAEDSKASKKTEDDSGAKTKEPTLKSGGKSGDVPSSKTPGKSKTTDDSVAASKATASTKSKDDGGASSSAKLPKSKQSTKKTPGGRSSSKAESPKIASSIAKGKGIKGGAKSKANGTGKPKTGSAKAKDTEVEDSSGDESMKEEEETIEDKPLSKGQASEAKSGKKRPRGG
ncbi:unnamed protein product [Linum tenue]|uniref:Tudor domain-containing protein n=1 Tax=Linum tenue TaxID=586396 RepID=A0AAV0K378_9ROSI|nr:unnamed protein product [Linum tenue]